MIKPVSKIKVMIILSPLLFAFCFLMIILCSLSFVSCQTSPKVINESRLQTTVPLDSGASVYLFADVDEMRFILDLLPVAELKDKQVSQMLDRTRSAAVALFPKESGRQYQITAWGNYPNSGIAFAFSFDKNWKRQRAVQGYAYWYSSANRLSVALNARQIFAASWLKDQDNYNPMAASPGIEYPEGFAEFRKNAQARTAPLSCWFNDPEPLINQVLENINIPIMIPAKKLFINLFPASNQHRENSAVQDMYDAEIKLQFDSVSQARGISTALGFASMFMPALQSGNNSGDNSFLLLASILFANPPVQDDSSINIKTASLSEKEIAQLFSIFYGR